MIDRLIINGDDFGMCEGNTLGILMAHKHGILTSTTVMMNMPYAKWALSLAKDIPALGVGVHLNITAGDPILKGDNSFVENGHFKNRNRYPDKKPIVDPDELYQELKAQIEAFIECTGHKPTHLDSHHHIHLYNPEVGLRLAKEYNLPIRQKEYLCDPYIFCDSQNFHGDTANLEHFKKIIESHTGCMEIMCHPGYVDQRLYDNSSYALERMTELAFLESDEVKEYIKENNISLINYSDIK